MASTWSRHFERKSIAQRCRRRKTRVWAVDYSWKLHANSTVITREKRGQTFRDRRPISLDVASLTFCVGDIFRPRAFLLAICVVLSIVNRMEKTGLEYVNWQPKYLNANIIPHCEISPLLKILNFHYSKILTVTPCFLFHFTQPTRYPVFLQKVPDRKSLVFKLIAPEKRPELAHIARWRKFDLLWWKHFQT